MLSVRVGKLVVKEYAYRKDGRDFWLCQCDCGSESIVKQCSLKSGNTKSCGCMKYKGGNKKKSRTKEEVIAFLKGYKKSDVGCWIFDGKLLNGGYGSITWNRKPWIAHRLAWTVFYGEIPNGMCVCHKCDVRNCINPEHLFLGTKQDNMHDMVEKGRSLYGEKNPKAKVTEELVREIRSVHNEQSVAELARRLCLSEGCLRHIIKNRSWKHV